MRKTPEQIRKEHIPFGCINLNSFDAENKAIDSCMKQYAQQEMAAFADWIVKTGFSYWGPHYCKAGDSTAYTIEQLIQKFNEDEGKKSI